MFVRAGVQLMSFVWVFSGHVCALRSATRDLSGSRLAEEILIRNVESGMYLVGGRTGPGTYCEIDNVHGYYVNLCALDTSDDGFVWVYSDGKLQNKKTGRWLYAEPWKDHEDKKNCAIVDWNDNAGADCVDNKCYNWVFVDDGTGRIKNAKSSFYLCAASWGENPTDAQVRVLDFDHPANQKDYKDVENSDLTGFQWATEPVPGTPTPPTTAPPTTAPPTPVPVPPHGDPTPAPPSPAPSTCNAHTDAWSDVKNQCGDCTVLAANIRKTHKSCKGYCQAQGLQCKGAWEDQSRDSCEKETSYDCSDTEIKSSAGHVTDDLLCKCDV